MFTVRTIRNPQVHCVGRMQGFGMLKREVRTVTTVNHTICRQSGCRGTSHFHRSVLILKVTFPPCADKASEGCPWARELVKQVCLFETLKQIKQSHDFHDILQGE
jgi:hypothetical protein